MINLNRSRGAVDALMYGLVLSIAMSFFAASSAQAAKAMFQFEQRQYGLAAGTSPPEVGGIRLFAEWAQGTPLEVTVGASAAQPTSLLPATPSIMLPASHPAFSNSSMFPFGGVGAFTGMSGVTPSGMITFSGVFQPITPSAFGVYWNVYHDQTSKNSAATFAKNWNFGTASSSLVWGVPTPTSGLITNGWPTGTTRCATLLGATTGGTAMAPIVDHCQPKVGNINAQAKPGGKKFGGTAQVFANVLDTFVISTFYYGRYSVGTFNAGGTTSKIGRPQKHPTAYLANGGLYLTNTGTLNTYRSLLAALGGGHTTGTVSVSNTAGFFNTNFTAMGYNNFNTANLTGTMLLIQPVIGNSFRTTGTTVIGVGSSSAASVRRTWLKFAPVPEPGTTALLGAGVLGLAGIYARRRG